MYEAGIIKLFMNCFGCFHRYLVLANMTNAGIPNNKIISSRKDSLYRVYGTFSSENSLIVFVTMKVKTIRLRPIIGPRNSFSFDIFLYKYIQKTIPNIKGNA